jgi:Spy/CpxP family protein refolding chaperone
VNGRCVSIRVGLWIVAVGLVAAAAAGEERHKWWQSERVRAEVGLSESQARQIEAIFQETLPQLQAAKAELDRQQAVLTRLIEAGSADEAQVVDAIERVEAARSNAGKLRTLMLYRMHRVLTPEQRARLKAFHDRAEKGHPDRRRY